jgi:hypothetical protein
MDSAIWCLATFDCCIHYDCSRSSAGECTCSVENHKVRGIEDFEEGWRREGEFTGVRVRVELVVAGELREGCETISLINLIVLELHVVGACLWVEAAVRLCHKFGASHHREVLSSSEGVEAALPDTL